jgi:hypothetical protein
MSSPFWPFSRGSELWRRDEVRRSVRSQQISAVRRKAMSAVAVAVIVISLIGLAMSAGFIMIPWSVQHRMTMDNSDRQAKGSYAEFLAEVESRQWTRDPAYPDGLFGPKRDGSAIEYSSEVFAHIVKFDNIGMLLGPIDWWRARRYLKAHAVPVSRPPVPLWKDR